MDTDQTRICFGEDCLKPHQAIISTMPIVVKDTVGHMRCLIKLNICGARSSEARGCVAKYLICAPMPSVYWDFSILPDGFDRFVLDERKSSSDFVFLSAFLNFLTN